MVYIAGSIQNGINFGVLAFFFGIVIILLGLIWKRYTGVFKVSHYSILSLVVYTLPWTILEIDDRRQATLSNFSLYLCIDRRHETWTEPTMRRKCRRLEGTIRD